MKLHVFHEPPPVFLGAALEVFEAQFRYPLGSQTTFSISHGARYITFFEAIGAPTLIVAERDGVVLGTIAASLRPLAFPDGSVHRVAYLGDLKVTPSARSGVVLARMFQELSRRISSAALGRAYAIVMDGTGRTPPAYTGRVGIPHFVRVGAISVLKVGPADSEGTLREVSKETLNNVVQNLAPAGFRPFGGQPSLRSSMTPMFLVNDDQSACGQLEDTRLAKRLLLPECGELRAAHLSAFFSRSPREGAAFLRGVSSRCASMGIPAFFTAIPARATGALVAELSGTPVVVAPATVYSCGFDAGSEADWFVDTAEI